MNGLGFNPTQQGCLQSFVRVWVRTKHRSQKPKNAMVELIAKRERSEMQRCYQQFCNTSLITYFQNIISRVVNADTHAEWDGGLVNAVDWKINFLFYHLMDIIQRAVVFSKWVIGRIREVATPEH